MTQNDYAQALLNKRTVWDEIGDNYANAAKQNPNTPRTNSIYLGISNGYKMHGEHERERKLGDLEEKVKQAAMMNAQLSTQLGKEQYEAAAYRNFANQLYRSGLLDDLHKKLKSGNEVEINDAFATAQGIFKKDYPDLAENDGSFDHINNYRVFMRDDEGNVHSGNLRDAMERVMMYLPPEIQKQYPEFLRYPMSRQFEYEDKMRDLNMQKQEADIGNVYSQTNYHNAQANHLNAQANNPPLDPIVAHAQKVKIDSSIGQVNKLAELIPQRQELRDAYSEIRGLIQEGKKIGIAGSGIYAKMNRLLLKGNLSDTEASKIFSSYEMAQQKLLPDLKRLFGGVQSEKDFEAFLRTLPSLEKNPDAVLAALDNLIAKQDLYIKRETKRIELLDQFNHLELPNSPKIEKLLNIYMQGFNNNE